MVTSPCLKRRAAFFDLFEACKVLLDLDYIELDFTLLK